MEILFTKPWLKAFSGLFINFSAGYFGLTFIAANFTPFSVPNTLVILTWNLLFGIVFFIASVKTEEILDTL